MSKKPLLRICEKHDRPIYYEDITHPKRDSIFDEIKSPIIHECPACKQVRKIKESLVKYPFATDVYDVIEGYKKRYLKTLECQGCKNMPEDFKCKEHRSAEEDEIISKKFRKFRKKYKAKK